MGLAVVLLDAKSARGRTACIFLKNSKFEVSHCINDAEIANLVVCDAEDIPPGKSTVFVMYRTGAKPPHSCLSKLVDRRYVVATTPGGAHVLGTITIRFAFEIAGSDHEFWKPSHFLDPDLNYCGTCITGVIGDGSEDAERICQRVEEAYRRNSEILARREEIKQFPQRATPDGFLDDGG